MKFINGQLRIRSIIPWIETEADFRFIRSHLLNRPTVTELQMASQIAKVTGDHPAHNTADASSVAVKEKQTLKSNNNLIIHYTHEKRFHTFKKDIHELWNQMFQCTPVSNTKLIIGHKNNRNATQELVRRRPTHLPKLIETAQQENTIDS